MTLHDPFSDTLYEVHDDRSVTIATEKVVTRIASVLEVATMTKIPIPSPATFMSKDEWDVALVGMPDLIVTTMARSVYRHTGSARLSHPMSFDNREGYTAANMALRYVAEHSDNGPDFAIDPSRAALAVTELMKAFNAWIKRV